MDIDNMATYELDKLQARISSELDARFRWCQDCRAGCRKRNDPRDCIDTRRGKYPGR